MDKELEEKLDALGAAVAGVREEITTQYEHNKERFGLLNYSTGAIAGLVLLLTAIVNETPIDAEILGWKTSNLSLALGGVILIFWLPFTWKVQSLWKK